MTYKLSLDIHKAKWIDDPTMRWNLGLERAGFNFRQLLQRAHYPPLPPSGINVRTYQTADKASYKITVPGREMVFGSTFYLPFILDGTVKWEGWPGKKDELWQGMHDGFASGVRDYKE